MDYIVLYSEDYYWDVWERYCDICGVHRGATCIKIHFDPKYVEYEMDDDDYDEEDDEDYDD